jgi:class 3 adenylate cyclase
MYRRWRNDTNLGVIRLAAASSIPTWLLTPWLGYLWRRDVDWLDIWWLGYVVVVPVLAAAVIATFTRLRRYATTLSAVALSVAGCAVLWIVAAKMRSIPGLERLETAGPAIANILLMACFALFLRLPPLAAVLAITPFTIAAVGVALTQVDKGLLPSIYGYSYVTTPLFTLFFVIFISVVGERFLRKAFINERLLLQQTDALSASRNLIRRYVPTALADLIIAGELDSVESPIRRRVTVLFSDIVGFTETADRVEPELLTTLISEYMSAMTQVVHDHGGTVNEFSGDGLMALFGAPTQMPPEVQANSAVRAAQAMQEKLPELNARWRTLGLDSPVNIRIGINTGMASVGSYGSEGRMTYTAIGLQTNIAARVQAKCEPGQILMTEATWRLLGSDNRGQFVGEIECKGVHFPVSVYSPAQYVGG